MKTDKILRKYYYEQIYTDGMPKFHRLEDGVMDMLNSSYGFAMFKVEYEFKKLMRPLENVLRGLLLIQHN